MLTGYDSGAPFDESGFGIASFYVRKPARTRGLDLFISFKKGVIHKTKHSTDTSRTPALPETTNVQPMFRLDVVRCIVPLIDLRNGVATGLTTEKTVVSTYQIHAKFHHQRF